MWPCSRREPPSAEPNSGMTGARSASICWCRSPSRRLTRRRKASAQVVGVDVGQRYLATVATLDNDTQFYSGKEVRAKADHYARVQKRLQRKGTRSATRRRIAIGQRERRLKLNTNHTISKHILDTHPHAFIGLEDLTGIRERTKRETRQEGDEAAAPRQSARLQVGLCRIARAARLQGGARRVALHQSGCRLHQPDLPALWLHQPREPAQAGPALCLPAVPLHPPCRSGGSQEYRLRTLVIRQDWMATGQLSDAPDVTDREAKAARLARYAELRWSLATSLLL